VKNVSIFPTIISFSHIIFRLHYDANELMVFEGIESEWPLFYTYMIMDGLFREDIGQSEEYRRLLEPLLVESSTLSKYNTASPVHETSSNPDSSSEARNSRRRSSSSRSAKAAQTPGRPPSGTLLVPELYIVPHEKVATEKEFPGTVKRFPNENVPLVWAQSLFTLGSLIREDLLSPAELDPLGRRLLPYRARHGSEVVVQIVILAETAKLQAKLAQYGLETQTVDMCEPVTISRPSALRDAYMSLGANSKLVCIEKADMICTEHCFTFC
jgi:hypothetical protein